MKFGEIFRDSKLVSRRTAFGVFWAVGRMWHPCAAIALPVVAIFFNPVTNLLPPVNAGRFAGSVTTASFLLYPYVAWFFFSGVI